MRCTAFILLSAVVAQGCSPLLGGAAVASFACDWSQTRKSSEYRFVGRPERNPVLGRHPTTARVDAYFALTGIGLIALDRVLGGSKVLRAGVMLVESKAVVDNLRNMSNGCGASL